MADPLFLHLGKKAQCQVWATVLQRAKLLTSSHSFCMCSMTVFWFSFIRFKINIAFRTNDLILIKAVPWQVSKFSSFFISLWNGYNLSSLKERRLLYLPMLDLKTVRVFWGFFDKIHKESETENCELISPMNFQKVWARVTSSKNCIVPFVLAATFREGHCLWLGRSG